jgi:hypothetical protein
VQESPVIAKVNDINHQQVFLSDAGTVAIEASESPFRFSDDSTGDTKELPVLEFEKGLNQEGKVTAFPDHGQYAATAPSSSCILKSRLYLAVLALRAGSTYL